MGRPSTLVIHPYIALYHRVSPAYHPKRLPYCMEIVEWVIWSSVLNMVLLLPPAPAARVLAGLAFATFASRSAAAFLLIAVAGPPGGFGDAG